MPAYDRAEHRPVPTGDDINWQQEYAILNRMYTDRCDEYNWAISKLEDMNRHINEMRSDKNKSETMAQEYTRLVIAIRNNLGVLHRRQILKDVEWFNDLLVQYKDKIHFDISPINANDYFTAKATIEIDGKWTGSNKDKHRITEIIKNVIMNTNMPDAKINIDDIIISDLYHSDVVADTKEG